MLKTLGIIGLCGFSFSTSANEIVINNGDFEAQPLADGGVIHNQIQGWETVYYTSGTGIYNPTALVLPTEAGVGEHGNTMWINSGALVKQNLNVPFIANTTYTLSFDIADRLDNNISNYTVRLKSGNTTIYSITNPLFPAEGTFEKVILSFDSGATQYEGELLSLEIETPVSSITKQINVDNFQLTYESVERQSLGFGEWQHRALGDTFEVGVNYLAETDGFITYFNGTNCNGNHDRILLTNPDGTSYVTARVYNYDSMMSPVKKGQYWKISRWVGPTNCDINVGFIPLNP